MLLVYWCFWLCCYRIFKMFSFLIFSCEKIGASHHFNQAALAPQTIPHPPLSSTTPAELPVPMALFYFSFWLCFGCFFMMMPLFYFFMWSLELAIISTKPPWLNRPHFFIFSCHHGSWPHSNAPFVGSYFDQDPQQSKNRTTLLSIVNKS